jgi:hypothetical protein
MTQVCDPSWQQVPMNMQVQSAWGGGSVEMVFGGGKVCAPLWDWHRHFGTDLSRPFFLGKGFVFNRRICWCLCPCCPGVQWPSSAQNQSLAAFLIGRGPVAYIVCAHSLLSYTLCRVHSVLLWCSCHRSPVVWVCCVCVVIGSTAGTAALYPRGTLCGALGIHFGASQWYDWPLWSVGGDVFLSLLWPTCVQGPGLRCAHGAVQ